MEVVETIQRITKKIAKKFKFGYHTNADMEQQAFIYGMKALDKYDPSRPLPNFLYRHILNRLINFKRDNFKRTDCPCVLCHNKESGSTGHEDKQYCKSFIKWRNRNYDKMSVIVPFNITNINDEKEKRTRINSSALIDIQIEELLEKIDRDLPVELRSFYLQMRQKISGIPKARRDEVIEELKKILGEDLCQKVKEED